MSRAAQEPRRGEIPVELKAISHPVSFSFVTIFRTIERGNYANDHSV